MSAVTADRNTKSRNVGIGVGEHPIAASTTIYAGTLTMRAETGGLLKNGADTAAHQFAGVATEYVDNSAGAASAKYGKVAKTGEYTFETASTITIANIGDVFYISDNQTVALTGDVSNHVACGVMVDLDGAKPVIRIDGYAI